MRSASIFILAAIFTMGLSAGAMAMGGGMGGGYGNGWSGQGMQPGYHMGGSQSFNGPGATNPSYGSNQDGWNNGNGARRGHGQGQGYGTAPNSGYGQSNFGPNGRTENPRN